MTLRERLAAKSDLIFLFFAMAIFARFSMDLTSMDFSWMQFQERDFSRASNFLTGLGLSHLGPEMGGGGFLPGPALTLLFALFAKINPSPRTVFVFLQLLHLAGVALCFIPLRRHLGRPIAWLSIILLGTSFHYFAFSFAAWHASLVTVHAIIALVVFDIMHSRGARAIWIGLVQGAIWAIGIQFHMSMSMMLFLWAALFLVLNPRLFLRCLPGFAITFLACFSFYIYRDFQMGFENSLALLNQPPRSKALSFLERFTHIWPSYSIYVFNTRFNLYLQIAIVGLGILAIPWRRSPQVRIVCLVLIAMLFTPVLVGKLDARFYIYTHPAIEILTAMCLVYSARFVFDKLSLGEMARERLGWAMGSAMALVVGVYLLPLIPGKNYPQAEAYSIYHAKYENFRSLQNFLIQELRLSPADYKNKFYFFHGYTHWLFHSYFQLPSYSHYQLIFEKQNGVPRDFGNYGVLVYPKGNDPYLSEERMRIVDTVVSEKFVAIIYESDYLYRNVPVYTERTAEERLLELSENAKDWTDHRTNEELELNRLFVLRPNHERPLRYLLRIKLRSDGGDLRGFAEIVSPFLRQSQYSERSPFFIENPSVTFVFKDRAQVTFRLVANHLYTKQAAVLGFDALFSRWGPIAGSTYLGSGYLEAPYGLPIRFKRPMSDLKKVVFSVGRSFAIGRNQPVVDRFSQEIIL